MDHIPLEIHMGLEIKGKLPDKTHCPPLSTKRWLMGWVLGQILKATGLSYGYFHKPCVSWGSLALRVMLPVKAMAPVPSAYHAHECAVIKERPISGEWKEWGAGGGCCWIFLSLFLPFFSLQLFLLTFSHSSFLISIAMSFFLYPQQKDEWKQHAFKKKFVGWRMGKLYVFLNHAFSSELL